jgi:perosamine synthetase
LRRLASRIRARDQAASCYRESLKDLKGITLPAPAAPGTEISWFVWVILVEKGLAGAARDGIIRRLNERGVGAQHYFPALHLQPFLQGRSHRRPGDLPITEEVSSRSIALPLFPGITAAEIGTVKRILAEELDHARTLSAAR